LAFNSWWSWSPERSTLFQSIDPEKWEQYRHNPVKLLNAVHPQQLAELAKDLNYLQRVEALAAQFQQYMQETRTWAAEAVPQLTSEQPIAYLSIEYGLHPFLPTYAGGLGVLAGDHLKSASDLGVPLIGVGLLYRQGYFRQRLNSDGWQEDYYLDSSFEELPLELCRNGQGEVLIVEVQIRDRPVKAQIWQVQVGRNPLYLLDTHRPENEPIDQELTAHLYGGGQDTRIAQEYLLGIGGIRALQALGIAPAVYHLNEGHAAFALLEVARLEMERTGHSFQEVAAAVKGRCVFTTHTPVPAGHDTFSPEQIACYFAHYWPQLGLSQTEFLNLGSRHPEDDQEPLNMTVLALRLTRTANGVSRLNGQVCRQMWSSLYPERAIEAVPIGYITNGIHAATWTAPLMADLYGRYLRQDWLAYVTDTQMWAQVEEIPDSEIWWRHQRLKEHLITYVRSHVQQARTNRGEPPEAIAAAGQLLDPTALTLCFARRFSPYKRGDLILQNPERARALISNPDRPVQIIFAGKAHPANEESKRIIQRLIQWSHRADLRDRIVFVEDYDLNIAEKLVQGADIWLNTPRPLKEASGTSGQKAAFNGSINCSILDGWWQEAYQPGPDSKGLNGWAIGNGRHDTENLSLQDQRDAEALYRLLEEDIVPCYYERDAAGIPHRWVQKMKASIKTIAPYFNTDRMVADYVTQMYLLTVKTERAVAGVV